MLRVAKEEVFVMFSTTNAFRRQAQIGILQLFNERTKQYPNMAQLLRLGFETLYQTYFCCCFYRHPGSTFSYHVFVRIRFLSNFIQTRMCYLSSHWIIIDGRTRLLFTTTFPQRTCIYRCKTYILNKP